MPPLTFAQLGVPDAICDALTARGITAPFEIQAATLTDALAGRDVLGRAPTGSGKTLAFGIPLIAGAERAQPKRPTALVLAPTRELADQISTELRSIAGDVRVAAVYGGVGYGPQLKALRRGVDILVACPGRLEDLLAQGEVALNEVRRVVLDEADRMADMGFIPAVRRLLDLTNPARQTVLFSATLDGDVAKLTRDYQVDPVRHEVGEETPDITLASHVFWRVERADRSQVTAEAVNAVWPAIVFCRTRHGSDRVAKQLGRAGIKAAAIHGGRSQGQRTRALADFAKGRVHALVATDVAARGIHVDGVASVIHFDPPEDHKTYVHRSGRTARAGEGGVVVSLVQAEQVKDVRRTQRKVGLDEPVADPDAGALRDLSPAPARVLEATPHDDEVAAADAPDQGRRQGSGNRRRRSSGSSQRSQSGGAQGRNGNRNAGSSKRSGGQAKSKRRSGSSQKRNGTGAKAGNTKRSGQRAAQGADGGSRSSKSSSGRASSNAAGGGGGGPSKNRTNRKARRAHLQPGARQR